jgi:Domain of unknown function (DUF4266)
MRRVPGVRFHLGLLGLAGGLLLAGCASVQPIEREMLSEPMMQLDDDPREQSHEQHWIETLEGSTGGYGGAAGGCACY